jgi:hypothetical protein
MNSVYEIDVRELQNVRQLQDVQQSAKGEFAAGSQLPWTRYEAKPFQDHRCPICGAFGCDGC